MRIWRMIAALPIALLGNQALAENWIDVGSTGIRVDKDSIRRGSDGLVYFTDNVGKSLNGVGIIEALAMDCQRRLTYVLRSDGQLSYGNPIKPNSIEDAELQYVCANAG